MPLYLEGPSPDWQIRHFSYRTANVADHVVSQKYTSGDNVAAFEKRLATAAGVELQNHVVFEVVFPDGRPPLYYKFSDWRVTVGNALREGSW